MAESELEQAAVSERMQRQAEWLREVLRRAPDGLARWQVWLAFRDKGGGALDTIAAIRQAKQSGAVREELGRLTLAIPRHPAIREESCAD